MIYKFRMISGEEKAFLRDYEIDSNSTFLALHSFIQKELDFDPQHLASFFLTDKHWNKGLELTLIDMDNDGGPAAIPMESVKLGDLLKQKKERLLYVFDIYTDRSLFMELLDTFPRVEGEHYPNCTASIGNPPQQIIIEEVDLDSLSIDDKDFDSIVNDIGSDIESYGLGTEFMDEEEDK